MTGGPRPGPAPFPPTDLARRALPLHTVPTGTLLHRVHRLRHDPLYFDAGSDGRWNDPSGAYGVCYCAERSYVAFAETFLRPVGLSFVTPEQLRERGMARLRVGRDLRLVSMHGAGLARLGATAAVVHGGYSTTHAWSRALHAHPGAPDGIRWRARHDDDGFAVALFARAADALREDSRDPLASAAVRAELAGWLDRYGLALLGALD